MSLLSPPALVAATVDGVVGPVVGETTVPITILRGRRGIRTPDFNRVKVYTAPSGGRNPSLLQGLPYDPKRAATGRHHQVVGPVVGDDCRVVGGRSLRGLS